MKHFTEDGEYKGETHEMDGKIHTGAKHSRLVKLYHTAKKVRLI